MLGLMLLQLALHALSALYSAVLPTGPDNLKVTEDSMLLLCCPAAGAQQRT